MKRGFRVHLCGLLCILLHFVLVVDATTPIPFGPAKSDPRLRWRTLETAHFEIHFHQGEAQLARRVAVVAEKVHASLTLHMQTTPHSKTHIIVNDTVDIVNGAASPFLYNQIYVYPTQPLLGLGHFDDWLESLLIHEYTHILDMGRVDGLAGAIQGVFGKFWFPKSAVPMFYTEGYATFNETQYTDGGRGRDPYTEMYLRDDFLNNNIPTLDQILFWGAYPGGHQHYTYGAAFFLFMQEKYAEYSPHTFQANLGSGLLPWNDNDSAYAATMRPIDWLWEEWKFESRKRYGRQRARIEQKPVTDSQILTRSQSSKWSPVWSAIGSHIYYFSFPTETHAEIRQVNLQTREDNLFTHLHALNQYTTLAISPDGKHITYPQATFHRSFSVYHDLWIKELQGDHSARWLTKDVRATSPAYSPAGDRLLAVQTRQGKTQLLDVDPDSGEAHELDTANDGLRFSEPAWAPDGASFAVSAWSEGGYQDIWVFGSDVENGRPILTDRAWDVSPCWTPDGTYIIFSSDRTGVFNLFAYELATSQLYQITNVIGGAFDPSISPDGTRLVFVGYSGGEFSICLMDLAPASWRPVSGNPADLQHLDGFFTGYGELESLPRYQGSAVGPGADLTDSPAEMEEHTYSPWSTLLPRFWLPYPTMDEMGLAIGAMTAGRDVLGKHTYAISAQYGAASRRPGYSLQYINDRFYPSLGLSVWDTTEVLQFQEQTLEEPDTWHRSRGAVVQIDIPQFTSGYQQGFSMGVQTEVSSYQDWPSQYPHPLTARFTAIFAGWRFSNTHRHARGISTADGIRLAFQYREYLPSLGSAIALSEFFVDTRIYRSMPFHRHVVALQVNALYNNRDSILPYTWLNDTSKRSFGDLHVGNYVSGSLEYRLPLRELRSGWRSVPLFAEQLHAAFFADYVRAMSLSENHTDWFGFGAELRLDFTALHLFRSTLRFSVSSQIHPMPERRIAFQLGESF